MFSAVPDARVNELENHRPTTTAATVFLARPAKALRAVPVAMPNSFAIAAQDYPWARRQVTLAGIERGARSSEPLTLRLDVSDPRPDSLDDQTALQFRHRSESSEDHSRA